MLLVQLVVRRLQSVTPGFLGVEVPVVRVAAPPGEQVWRVQ